MTLSLRFARFQRPAVAMQRTTMSRLYHRSQVHDKLNENGWLTTQSGTNSSLQEICVKQGKYREIPLNFSIGGPFSPHFLGPKQCLTPQIPYSTEPGNHFCRSGNDCDSAGKRSIASAYHLRAAGSRPARRHFIASRFSSRPPTPSLLAMIRMDKSEDGCARISERKSLLTSCSPSRWCWRL
jgi:hypothetical protein